ncbi:hypothetical protein V8E36_009865 [Tilletia maclaganii]
MRTSSRTTASTLGSWDLRQLADQVAKKWEVDVSYDLMCRLAWLRKTAKETVTFDDEGSEWWDLVQLELDAILKLMNHKDAREREKGAKCFSRALSWDLNLYGACDDLRDEKRGAREAAIENDIRNAGNEDVDDEEIEDADADED